MGRFGIGFLTLVGCSLGATAYLVWEQRNGAELWAYYPIKLAWLTMEVMLICIIIAVAVVVGTLRTRRWLAVAAMAASVVLVGSVMRLNGPGEGYLGTWATIAPSRVGVLDNFPLLALAAQTPDTEALLAGLEQTYGERIVYFEYRPNIENLSPDNWVNLWEFSAEYMLTKYMWTYPLTVPLICEMPADWHGPVTVITSNAAAAADITSQCGEDVHVELRPLPA